MKLEINPEELRKKSLFVGTPMFGGTCVGLYLKSCLDLQTLFQSHGIPIKFSFLFNESLITRARNYVVDEFLRSEFTHLIFIDADIEFNPMDVLACLALDKDIVGAPYPKKAIKWSAVMEASRKIPEDKLSEFNPNELSTVMGDYVFNPVPGTERFDVTEPLEVMELGTGFMMVRRDVFTKFAEEYPHLRYKPDHVGQANFDGSRYIHAYFDTMIDPVTDRYLSEDYAFSRMARDIGFSIFMCPWMKTTHVGTFGFTGNMPAIASAIGKLN